MSEEIEYRGFTIKIIPDSLIEEGPRDWDNLGTMACWHKRYELGDTKFTKTEPSPTSYMFDLLPYAVQERLSARYEREEERCGKLEEYADLDNDYGGWVQAEFDKIALSLPLYLYDHSGITMNTPGFSCPWDSGQVGFIYVTKKKLLEEHVGWMNISKKRREQVYEWLANEVGTYDQFLRGDVWGYSFTDENGDEPDDNSCWGFYGYDYCVEEAKGAVDSYITWREKKRAERLKELVTNHVPLHKRGEDLDAAIKA